MSKLFDFLKKNRKISIPVGVVLALVLIIVLARGNGKKNNAYQTDTVKRGELTATVGATGSVRAIQSATLNWQTTGTVEDVNMQVGDKVRANDVLANLAKTSLPQNIILAQADLVTAQQALDDLLNSDTDRAQAWITLRDAQDAYKKADNYRQELNHKTTLTRIVYVNVFGRIVPQVKYYQGFADPETIADADADLALKKAQLDDAQRAFDRLKGGPNSADLAAAQAKVDAAQATLNMGRILAPFNGTVTQAEPLAGDQVTAGELAFRVDDLSSLLVDVQVSEVDINSVQVGQPVTLTFDAILDKEYHGEVVEVAQAGDVSSGAVNFTVTVKLTDADAQVKPGMTAAVNVTVNQVSNQLLIPNRAVRLVDGNKVVYILKNGQPQPVPVTLGLSDGVSSVVGGGDLKEGDLIILNPPTQPGGPRFGGGGG
ncbi:MAG TPA: efflux RND transporter periplasmic adaptor subunit [Anaerolineales bacterium]|jgi:HlyD family secretion protein|nr:efflux RND transporter periplasmic adaptor subunit [Anaerolineales bacterium]